MSIDTPARRQSPHWLARTLQRLRASVASAAPQPALPLDAVLNALPAAVAVYDADDRLVAANPQYRVDNAPLADLLRPGTRFESLVRARVQRGLVPDAAGREEAWIAARLASHRNPGLPLVVAAAEGRWLRIVERRLDGGGTLVQNVDITDVVQKEQALEEARRQAELAHERLVDAIEAMPATFELYDADDRLVMHNQALARAYPHLLPHLEQHLRFAELARLDAAHSGQPELLGALDEWLARREAQRRAPLAGHSTLIATPDGRWMRMYETRLRRGGMVAIRVDVTEQKLREQELTRLNERLDRANAELSRLSDTDALTGLSNRRRFDRRLGEEWARAVRHRLPLALAIFDVDYFKRYNDCHGHPAGDACLRAVAEVLRGEARRAGDVVARLGGEEFAILLPYHGQAAARAMAQRCLDALDRAAIAHGDSPLGAQVSCSAGVADLAGVGSAQGPAALVAAADAALYAAKQAGRHRVLCGPGLDPGPVPGP